MSASTRYETYDIDERSKTNKPRFPTAGNLISISAHVLIRANWREMKCGFLYERECTNPWSKSRRYYTVPWKTRACIGVNRFITQEMNIFRKENIRTCPYFGRAPISMQMPLNICNLSEMAVKAAHNKGVKKAQRITRKILAILQSRIVNIRKIDLLFMNELR